MEKKREQSEELLRKLTEIYDQLEQLEKSIDTNVAEHRKNLLDVEKRKYSVLEKKITVLETKLSQVKENRTLRVRKANGLPVIPFLNFKV